MSDTIDDVLDDPNVQPNQPNPGNTWCNRAAERIIDNMGYNTDPILDLFQGEPDINWTSANDMAQNAANAADDPNSGVSEVTEQEARDLSNAGVPVLAVAENPGDHGHAGVVAPSDGDTTMIGQSGANPGISDVDTAFGDLADDVHYYRLPER